MKAFILESYSQGPRLKEVAIPKPQECEVLIKVAYCGVNQVDLKVIGGLYGNAVSFPLILGAEIVGTTPKGKKVAVNPYVHCDTCTYCKKGEYLVCATGRLLLGVQRNGGYAEYVLAPRDNIIEIPDGISLEEAAALTLSAGTAYRMIHTMAKLKAKETVIITAAASGVGVYSCQFARLLGAEIIALAGSNEKLHHLKTIGVQNTINYTQRHWQKTLSSLIARKPVDVLIDTVGGLVFESLVPLVSPLGRIVFCGATSDPSVTINLIDLYVKQKKLIGSSGYFNGDLRHVFSLLKSKKIRPIVDSVFSLSSLPQALKKLQSRKVFGKILIKIP